MKLKQRSPCVFSLLRKYFKIMFERVQVLNVDQIFGYVKLFQIKEATNKPMFIFKKRFDLDRNVGQ